MILDKEELTRQLLEIASRFDSGTMEANDYIKIRLYYKRVFEGKKDFDTNSYSGIENCNKCTRYCVNQLRAWAETN